MIEILQQNLPGVAIYIQAIPGVQETVVQTKPGLDNARIQTINNMLANICPDPRHAISSTFQEALTYPDGSQIDEYQTSDGIHMGPAGYAAWLIIWLPTPHGIAAISTKAPVPTIFWFVTFISAYSVLLAKSTL